MDLPLLTCFLFACKIIICIAIIVAFHTHHWTRDETGSKNAGYKLDCENYGTDCRESMLSIHGLWFFCILPSISVLFEFINMILLCIRKRSCVNLILEELNIIIVLILFAASAIVVILGFVWIFSHNDNHMDWSFFVFILASGLTLIDFICSIIRAVSYCRENSFRSTTVTYQSHNHHQTVHIQA